uniref:Uncharacterized protein n=1 Tax=Trichobilharzia regenti TaxID=157069 RepID=A0AA85J453_TRIRE|nr:unnamed protein product [Trichobilharzia regenti]
MLKKYTEDQRLENEMDIFRHSLVIYLSGFHIVWCWVVSPSQVGEMVDIDWRFYTVMTSLVLIVPLIVLSSFRFRTNPLFALILIEITILLWSLDIILMCCTTFDYSCYLLIGFIFLQDAFPIIYYFVNKKLKREVELTMLSILLTCFIAVLNIFSLKPNKRLLFELAGCFWNTSVVSAAFVFISLLK